MEFNFIVMTDDDQVKGREQETYDAIGFAIAGAMNQIKDGGPMSNSRAVQAIDFEIAGNYYSDKDI